MGFLKRIFGDRDQRKLRKLTQKNVPNGLEKFRVPSSTYITITNNSPLNAVLIDPAGEKHLVNPCSVSGDSIRFEIPAGWKFLRIETDIEGCATPDIDPDTKRVLPPL